MSALPVGAVGDNLRCLQPVLIFLSSANSCSRAGDLFDVLAHSYALVLWSIANQCSLTAYLFDVIATDMSSHELMESIASVVSCGKML